MWGKEEWGEWWDGECGDDEDEEEENEIDGSHNLIVLSKDPEATHG